MTSKRTPASGSMVEIRQYMKLKNIETKEDPLLWWQQNQSLTKSLCIPGTSVPAERLFSKPGQLVSARRNRLKPKHVNTFLFLNKNL